jgi:hypothetical protein
MKQNKKRTDNQVREEEAQHLAVVTDKVLSLEEKKHKI